jgi:hypothetical protein
MKYVKFVRLPIDDGISPERSLPSNAREVKFMRLPISDGIPPER